MDVLSDVLGVIRAGRARSAVGTWHAPWAQWFPPVPGAVGFRVVVAGECVLLPAGAQPVRLRAGDMALLLHGGGHVLADGPVTTAMALASDPTVPDRCEPGAGAAHDTAGPATVTLCGAYELAPAGSHPLLHDLPEVVHLRTGDRTELKAAVDLLGAELARPRLGTDGLVPALLDMLLLYALRTWFEEQPPEGRTGGVAALHDPAVALALDAIHQAPEQPWTVAALAGLGGLSRAPFARRFTALAGQSPIRYLTWWRMTTAARLLRDTDAPLTVVAADVGYQSEFAFAVAFKRQYGTAPGRYRRSTNLESRNSAITPA